MQHQITQQIYPVLQRMLPQGAVLSLTDVEKLIQLPRIENSGFDYTLSCGPLSKILKMKPQEIAEGLCQILHENSMKPPIREAVADKIFVNFTLDKSLMVRDILNTIRKQGENYGKTSSGQGKIICIEYSSPNIAKHFAVYHLITTLLGYILGNLYVFRGWKVIRLNHIGDWGTNIGYLISAIQSEIGKEQFLKL
ncbi:MAG: arginine--tRNA ligase, partial [Planctomycetota bacterium]